MDKEEALRGFLGSINISDEELIKDLNSVSALISKRKGDIIFLEDDNGSDMYYLIKGGVKLYKSSYDGGEITINIVKEGEFFAEIVLFLKNRYPVSAIAIENSILLSINAQRLFETIKLKPDFALKMLAIFSHRINYLANKIRQISTDKAEDKVFKYLKSSATKDNTIKFVAPKKEIATLLGITPETLSRTLRKLKEKGFIEQKGKIIRLKQ